ncbi:hypothetical protein M501DRAFT_1012383 [Patellaria atrata CBS 101060]|uniref:Zn(2)-C6 fungal-type domain-containing protein n=1 Tax=Patellaria atrata CBS 101060 TaxID=1346257 RepID=A0A9P4SIQ1_9PEZI|nr:hypothetical protein M501DRAFT_1012383 [Patellaria atrata CBS 101060]
MSESFIPDNIVSTKRSKRACTECRQQKARCDAYLDPGKPCSRCCRLNVHCVILEPFKREHKRQRLTELQHETDVLRRRLGTTTRTDVHASSLDMLAAAAESDNHSQRTVSIQSSFVPRANAAVQVNDVPTAPVPDDSVGPPPLSIKQIEEKHMQPTQAQSLDGIEIDAVTIDELYQIYLTEYNEFLPIMCPSISPNKLYAVSPFLFWAVMSVSCRRHPIADSILAPLASRVIDLALQMLKAQYAALPSIKGFIVLLMWPFTKRSLSLDVTFPLAGAMIHMAMRIGLHIPASSQDFSKVRLRLTDDDVNRRAELWAFCILTYQRTCQFMGQPPLTLVDGTFEPDQQILVRNTISRTIRFQVKLQAITTKCCSALVENGLHSLNPDRERAMNILLRVFRSHIQDMEGEAYTDLDRSSLYIANLTLDVFHFYKDLRNLDPLTLTRLYTSAVRVVEDMDKNKTIMQVAPRYFPYALMLATTTLLRLLKSSTAKILDYESAKGAYFLGASLSQQLSPNKEELPARMTPILIDLWDSKRAFRNPDGSEQTVLRVRSRLAMSPVLDALWWWREEFQGQVGDFKTPSTISSSKSTIKEAITPSVEPFMPDTPVLHSSMFNADRLSSEMGWLDDSNDPGFTVLDSAYGLPWMDTMFNGGFPAM